MGRNLTNIKSRILELVKSKGFKVSTFFDEIGDNYENYKGKKLETVPKSDVIVKIRTKIPDLNLEWLLTGEGPMLKSEVPKAAPMEPEIAPNEVAELKKQIKILTETNNLLTETNNRLTETNNRLTESFLELSSRVLPSTFPVHVAPGAPESTSFSAQNMGGGFLTLENPEPSASMEEPTGIKPSK